ncbi:MAG: hypothetical protein GY756_12785, partial [bacterium]|nr:hypothetical protein [bacterium]
IAEETIAEETIAEETIAEETIAEETIAEKTTGYTYNSLFNELNGLSVFGIGNILLDPDLLLNTSVDIKDKVFQDLKKTDFKKYTLINIIPGLGSAIQGDYFSTIYVVLSIVGAIVYNLSDGFGTDFALAVNLNMVIAYVTSFFAPYNYSNNYNNKLNDLIYSIDLL